MLAIIYAVQINIFCSEVCVHLPYTYVSKIINAQKREEASTSLGEGRRQIYEHELHWNLWIQQLLIWRRHLDLLNEQS